MVHIIGDTEGEQVLRKNHFIPKTPSNFMATSQYPFGVDEAMEKNGIENGTVFEVWKRYKDNEKRIISNINAVILFYNRQDVKTLVWTREDADRDLELETVYAASARYEELKLNNICDKYHEDGGVSRIYNQINNKHAVEDEFMSMEEIEQNFPAEVVEGIKRHGFKIRKGGIV